MYYTNPTAKTIEVSTFWDRNDVKCWLSITDYTIEPNIAKLLSDDETILNYVKGKDAIVLFFLVWFNLFILFI